MSLQTMIDPVATASRASSHPDAGEVSATRSNPASDPLAGRGPWQADRRWTIAGWLLPVVLGGLSGLLSLTGMTHSWFYSWPGLLALTMAVVTAGTDSIWQKIPNWITYPTILAGLAIGAVVSRLGPSTWAGSVDLSAAGFGLLACFFCMLVPYRASGGGAADVKLAAAYGALLGWQAGISMIITAYIVAGAGLLIIHLTSNHPWLLPKAMMRLVGSAWLPKLVDAPNPQQQQVLSRPIPLAGAFAIALISVLCGGNLFAA